MKKMFEDPSELDGYDDLRSEDKEKVNKAWEDGQVADEDIPETARKPAKDNSGSEDEAKEKAKKKKAAGAAKKRKAAKDAVPEDDDDDENEKPKKKRAPPKKAPAEKKKAPVKKKGPKKKKVRNSMDLCSLQSLFTAVY